MRILILGGNGYLGSHIAACLCKNEDVTVAVRMGADIQRLNLVRNYIRFVDASIQNISLLLQREPFDWIINCVCSYGKSGEDEKTVIQTNFDYPLSVLDVAVKYAVNNFMTIGTGLPESFNIYSMTKADLSRIGKKYSQEVLINFIELKLQMFYGADEPKSRFLPMCIDKMIAGEDIELTTGEQKRDLVSVQDVEALICHILNIGVKGYRVFEVGCGEAPSIREIVEYMGNYLHSESKLLWGAKPARIGEPDCIANIERLDEIGFVCKIDWKTGLREMIDERRKNAYTD